MRKLRELFSVQVSKNPRGIILLAILNFNIFFILISALIISSFSLHGTEQMSFLEAAFCTITMILDAGCVSFVIEDIGTANVLLALLCLVIIFVGMISFTGAVIGYITSWISGFIENANAGSRKLELSDHIVILNWNNRASEIVNDLLYSRKKHIVLVLVDDRRDEIVKEIDERISDTISRENDDLKKLYEKYDFFRRHYYYWKYHYRKNLTVIVREGEIFSSKQLRDISLERAKTVIILENDYSNSLCKYEAFEKQNRSNGENSKTIKTLMQVADITGSDYSDDNQKIIVEITNQWAEELVNKVIRAKQVDGKCNIVPVRVNEILGELLAQFCLMPELNLVYRELFSNKGASFFTVESEQTDEIAGVTDYLVDHRHAIPLTSMESNGVPHFYYMAGDQTDINLTSMIMPSEYTVDYKYKYMKDTKNVVILGHNSKCHSLMQGFVAFCNEFGKEAANGDILRITVIDDQNNLEKMNYYREYPFVQKTIAADIYQKDVIINAIKEAVDTATDDTSILILSDDMVSNDDIDANALTNLIYVQDIINDKLDENPDFDTESIDVIVEIIDPKHHDIVSSYSVKNVVISNRFISKMITQIGEKEALFNFYQDILTYDEEDSTDYESKEIYIRPLGELFTSTPEPTTADQFIRALYIKSITVPMDDGAINPMLALGYIKHDGHMILFSGDQRTVNIRFDPDDKLIVFSNH